MNMRNDKEYILCAAIKRKSRKEVPNPYYEGTNDILGIEVGYRHHDIYARFKGELDLTPEAQGFYTSKGRFVGRVEAMKVAYEAGQVDEKTALVTEDSLNSMPKINSDIPDEVTNDEFRKNKYFPLFSENLY